MLQNFIKAYSVLACVLMEATAQGVHDLYVRAILNTSFLNDGTPIKIFNETSKTLLVVTGKDVFSVTIEEQSGLAQETFAVTNARLLKHVRSLYDVVIIQSNQLLFSDETTCLKMLNLVDSTIEPYVGNCAQGGTADGPRLQAQFRKPRCLLRVNNIIYIADEVGKSIRMMTLNPTGNIATVFTDSSGYMISPAFMSACDADILYLTVSHGVVEIVISDSKIRLIAGSQTPGIGDNIALDFYRQKNTTNAFNIPKGIIALTPQLIVVADSANHRLRLVFPVFSLNHTLVNITQSVCIEGIDIPRDGSIENCALRTPHSVNLLGNRIIIGEKNVLRIVSDYRDVYKALSQQFGNTYTDKELGRIRQDKHQVVTIQSTTGYKDFPASKAFDGLFDGNYSHTRSANNQWWKVYLVDSPIYLDKVVLHYRRKPYYKYMKDLFVLTSLLADARTSIPSLNDSDWPECFYRNENDQKYEEVRCTGVRPLSKQIAVYIRENDQRGVALEEVIVYGSWVAEVAYLIGEKCHLGSVTVNNVTNITHVTQVTQFTQGTQVTQVTQFTQFTQISQVTQVTPVTHLPTSLLERFKNGSLNTVLIIVGSALAIAVVAGILLAVCIKRCRVRGRRRSIHRPTSTRKSLARKKVAVKRRKKHAENSPSMQFSNWQAGNQGVMRPISEMAGRYPSPTAANETVMVKRIKKRSQSAASRTSVFAV